MPKVSIDLSGVQLWYISKPDEDVNNLLHSRDPDFYRTLLNKNANLIFSGLTTGDYASKRKFMNMLRSDFYDYKEEVSHAIGLKPIVKLITKEAPEDLQENAILFLSAAETKAWGQTLFDAGIIPAILFLWKNSTNLRAISYACMTARHVCEFNPQLIFGGGLHYLFRCANFLTPPLRASENFILQTLFDLASDNIAYIQQDTEDENDPKPSTWCGSVSEELFNTRGTYIKLNDEEMKYLTNYLTNFDDAKFFTPCCTLLVNVLSSPHSPLHLELLQKACDKAFSFISEYSGMQVVNFLMDVEDTRHLFNTVPLVEAIIGVLNTIPPTPNDNRMYLSAAHALLKLLESPETTSLAREKAISLKVIPLFITHWKDFMACDVMRRLLESQETHNEFLEAGGMQWISNTFAACTDSACTILMTLLDNPTISETVVTNNAALNAQLAIAFKKGKVATQLVQLSLLLLSLRADLHPTLYHSMSDYAISQFPEEASVHLLAAISDCYDLRAKASTLYPRVCVKYRSTQPANDPATYNSVSSLLLNITYVDNFRLEDDMIMEMLPRAQGFFPNAKKLLAKYAYQKLDSRQIGEEGMRFVVSQMKGNPELIYTVKEKVLQDYLLLHKLKVSEQAAKIFLESDQKCLSKLLFPHIIWLLEVSPGANRSQEEEQHFLHILREIVKKGPMEHIQAISRTIDFLERPNKGVNNDTPIREYWKITLDYFCASLVTAVRQSARDLFVISAFQFEILSLAPIIQSLPIDINHTDVLTAIFELFACEYSDILLQCMDLLIIVLGQNVRQSHLLDCVLSLVPVVKVKINEKHMDSTFSRLAELITQYRVNNTPLEQSPTNVAVQDSSVEKKSDGITADTDAKNKTKKKKKNKKKKDTDTPTSSFVTTVTTTSVSAPTISVSSTPTTFESTASNTDPSDFPTPPNATLINLISFDSLSHLSEIKQLQDQLDQKNLALKAKKKELKQKKKEEEQQERKREEEKKKSIEEEMNCGICLVKKKNAVMDPCGHMLCMECAKAMMLGSRKCPFCRRLFKQYKPVYW